jgi:hypothetical protein
MQQQQAQGEATFACGSASTGTRRGTSATQLMPAAQLPAKYLCLLLGTFAFDLATQLMPAAHKQGRQKQQAAYAAA